jgi:hypothetical protein
MFMSVFVRRDHFHSSVFLAFKVRQVESCSCHGLRFEVVVCTKSGASNGWAISGGTTDTSAPTPVIGAV